jgi:SAM-dependent MidA family methyltransferase
MQHPSALPELTPAQSAHSARLVDRIHDVIDAQAGWINFERFMEMALYEPGLGYYSAGSSKLGAGGDFVTAPEVSSLFSRCLATQCAEILQHVSGGAILEFGAGSGVMAADLLNELGAQGALP